MPVGTPLTIRKMIPYDGSLGAEPIDDLEREITVQVDRHWRVAFGICRDLLNNDAVSALTQIGANLVAIPACSPKTTNLAANALMLAAHGPGIVMMANGPRFFPNASAASAADVPMSVVATALDQVHDPIHIASCTPPQLCIYEFKTNSVKAV